MLEHDEEFIRKALSLAHPNALRLAIYHQIRDPRLAAMEAKTVPAAGGALKALVVDRDHNDELQQIAFDHLAAATTPRPNPTKPQARELMNMFTGSEISPRDFDWGFEELAFDDMPPSLPIAGPGFGDR